MPNRLANETSPYLRQHADNPVDWYPWGPGALERAKREDRPILLSIGYAACHWCHVMAHESFEDEATARLMNELFVNIKVDREERPDLDGIYMQATQAMTGHGGWPMTVFLTPEGVPFYAGTYFPPEDRHGMPSFRRVLGSIADAYRRRRADVERTGEQVRQMYDAARLGSSLPSGRAPLHPQMLERAWLGLARQFDARHGGFGGAPKFPQVMALDFSLRHWGRTGAEQALAIALHSFRRMARGGIYDQVGGGFARYAVDAVWLVPHFEKMLYDNALLARLGIHLWQATQDREVRRVTEETIDWVAREMTSPEGGFYSSLDADSEGHEGKFYLWTPDEMDALLGAEDGALARAYWGVTAGGNFEGANILHVPDEPAAVSARHGVSPERLAEAVSRARRVLYEARARRVWPGRDDKVLASWNGLMLRAVAEGARAFGRADWRAAAVRTGEYLVRTLVQDGRVRRSPGASFGFLEDAAALALGALALYELTLERTWLDRARDIADVMIERFWDAEAEAFFDTPSDHETLITRPRDVTDNATPAGTSLAAELLARLAEVLHDADHRRRAAWVLESLAEPMARHPLAFGHLLGVADLVVRGATELALVGDSAGEDFAALLSAASTSYVPALVLAGGRPERSEGIGLLADRPLVGGRATAYVCRNYTCQAPVNDAAALTAQLAEVSASR